VQRGGDALSSSSGRILVAGMNGNLAGIDTPTLFEAHRHGGNGQSTDYRLVQRSGDALSSSSGRKYVAAMNGNLAGIDTSTIFEAQRHGGDGQ
jgi:hypothetical protein